MTIIVAVLLKVSRIHGIIAAMIDEKCQIIENKYLNKNYYLLKIKAEAISKQAKPGNFVMVRILSEAMVPLLRRPFGILGSDPPHIWLYYEVVGKGTQLLSRLKQQDELVMLGPLGNSFPVMKDKKVLLVAGGRGIAPLFYAGREAAGENEVSLLYGARTKNDLNLLDELKQLGFKKQFLFTDDGSYGDKGLVTCQLRRIVEENGIEVTFSCGPGMMYNSISKELADFGSDNYVSLEAIMGCGFGICHSCVIPSVGGSYKKVCSEGPIFKLEEIDWQTFQ